MKRKKKIDLTNYGCPMIFVKTKIFLEQLGHEKSVTIIVKGRNNFLSLKETLLEQEYDIKYKKNLNKNDEFEIDIFKD